MREKKKEEIRERRERREKDWEKKRRWMFKKANLENYMLVWENTNYTTKVSSFYFSWISVIVIVLSSCWELLYLLCVVLRSVSLFLRLLRLLRPLLLNIFFPLSFPLLPYPPPHTFSLLNSSSSKKSQVLSSLTQSLTLISTSQSRHDHISLYSRILRFLKEDDKRK